MRIKFLPVLFAAFLFLIVWFIVYVTEYVETGGINVLKQKILLPEDLSLWNYKNTGFPQLMEATGNGGSDNNENQNLSVVHNVVTPLQTTHVSDIFKDKYIKEIYLKNVSVDDKNDCMKKKFLVYKCSKSLCGGWGDRLKGIVTSFLLALLTNRVFVIDMTKPCELEQFLKHDIYNWATCINYTRSVADKTTVYATTARAFLKIIKRPDKATKWNNQILTVTSNAYLIDALRRHRSSFVRLKWLLKRPNEEIIYLVLHTLFKAGEELSFDLNNFSAKYFKTKHVVCSHIRVGKNPSNPNDSALPKGGPNTTTVLSFLTRFSQSDEYVIYIASDSEKIKADATRMYSNFINANRTIIHVDRAGKGRTKGEICAGFYNVLFEQYLLVSCDTLVLTRSNFGATAAYIRGKSENLFLFENATNSVINVTLFEIQRKYKFV